MSFYGGERLRLNQHDFDSGVLAQDAIRTLSHKEFLQEDFHKLLTAMLSHAPTQRGKDSIAKNIVSLRVPAEEYYHTQVETNGIAKGSKDDKELAFKCYTDVVHRLNELKEHLYAAVILPFMNSLREDVPPNPCWADGYAEKTKVTPATRSSTRKDIIVRDNYRCCATSRLDIEVELLLPRNKQKVLDKEIYAMGGRDSLQVAHVVPFSLNKFNPRKPTEVLRAKRIWTALTDFTGVDLSSLKGKGINDKSNLFMLSPVAHKFYDDFLLSFSPSPAVGKTHRVQIWGDRASLVNIRGDVKLAVDPDWLTIHYAIFRIVYDAGSNKVLREIAAVDREGEGQR